MSEVAPASQGQPDQLLLSVGDIGVARIWVVTPSGTYKLARR